MSHALVLAGQSDAAEPLDDVPDFVRVTGYVPEQDLHVLYHEAELFVYPSSYGRVRPARARGHGRRHPVLTARNSALVEVAGDATLLVDEPRRDLLADALTRLLTDAALRDQLAGGGDSEHDSSPEPHCDGDDGGTGGGILGGRVSEQATPLRLNLGSGNRPLPGS